MSTRRKPSNPCVLLSEDSVETGVSTEPVLDGYSPMDHEEDEPSEGGSSSERGLFHTQNLQDRKDFSMSEDSGNGNDSQLSRENHSCQEQTVRNQNTGFVHFPKDSSNSASEDSENKGIASDSQLSSETVKNQNTGFLQFSSSSGNEDTASEISSILEKGPEVEKEPCCPGSKDKIRAVSVNGTLIIPEMSCHVTPLLQRPPNLSTSPAIAVPIHTSKYNPVLDRSTTLMASFSRFPYPTQAELSWLTAASRHPEEQIKVWFTTQRLKQGISWSPEEVEEARKKMFNGSLWQAPTTCHGREKNSTDTVLLSPSACMPLKRSLGSPLFASEVKRPLVAPLGDLKESLRMPPPPVPPTERAIIYSAGLSDARTSSPDSLVASGGKKPAPKEFKEKIPIEAPKERLPLSPIVLANLRRSQQINSHSSAVSKSKFGAAMIQTLPPVPLSSLLQPSEPAVTPVVPCFNTYNVGDRKHRFFGHSTTSLNQFQNSEFPTPFPLLERVKDKSPGQMKLLEESFQRNSFLSYNEVEQLQITTGLSREDIESWFLERRALRDDLEQALLNSMGCKQESQQTLFNGAPRCSGSLPFSPQDGKSMNLLKNVIVQNRWTSPVDVQTRLARWFRDGRLAPQSCVLDQTFGQKNGCRAADTTRRPSHKERQFREENKQPSSPEIENLFNHTGSNREEMAEDGDTRGGWMIREQLSESE